jgi:hypothetical protein
MAPAAGPGDPGRTVTRHIRTAAWAVVGLLTFAIVASLVFDGLT